MSVEHPTHAEIRNARMAVWFMAGIALVSIVTALLLDGGGRALCILLAGASGSMAALGAVGPYYRARE